MSRPSHPLSQDPALDRCAEAASALGQGGLVAFPTETIYAIAADASDAAACARLADLTDLPAAGGPPTVHLVDHAQLASSVEHVPDEARRLVAAFWPGPLTVLLPPAAALRALPGLDHPLLALRLSSHPLAQAFLRHCGRLVAVRPARTGGRLPATSVPELDAGSLAELAAVLDGGPCAIGLESTVVDCSSGEAVVLRRGALLVEDLERVLGRRLTVRSGPAAGSWIRDHGPRLVVAAADEAAAQVQALLADGLRVGLMGGPARLVLPAEVLRLPLPRSPGVIARVLYARIRLAQRLRLDALVAVPPPAHGLGRVVCDRLQRLAGLPLTGCC